MPFLSHQTLQIVDRLLLMAPFVTVGDSNDVCRRADVNHKVRILLLRNTFLAKLLDECSASGRAAQSTVAVGERELHDRTYREKKYTAESTGPMSPGTTRAGRQDQHTSGSLIHHSHDGPDQLTILWAEHPQAQRSYPTKFQSSPN